ncbi:LLM class flavin-dependent oxidoreductase [Paenibacillus agricola]|uniref:LLM class flavin-dependent oxidoreductase n=1 Tax=Paenibacillus agricola TaxID=2716264 RepID=UPI0028932853|nr:LLM class flavin-dependent oxidoreductase [Paenibacillus agricola]
MASCEMVVPHDERYDMPTNIWKSAISYGRAAGRTTEPSPQRSPVIFQAGSSGRGRAFAARHAEGVFLKAPTLEVLRDQVQDIRRQAQAFGRDPEAVKVFNGLSVIVAPTREEALHKQAEFKSYQSAEATLLSYYSVTGIDLTALDPDSIFENIKGVSRLPAHHPGASYRVNGASS